MEAVRKKKKWAEVIPIKLANCALNNKDSLHIFCTSFLRIGFQKKINNDNKFVMVEAGGIEPPSEGLQHKAATCLVCVFKPRRARPTDRLCTSRPPFGSLPARGALTARFAHSHLTPVRRSMGRPAQDVAALRQPVRKNNRRHLLVFCLFYEVADLGMLLVPQLPPSNPLRPLT